MSPDQATESGVYYRREDYLGFARRLLIDFVDIPAAILLSVVVLVAARAVAPQVLEVSGLLPLLWLVSWVSYFVVLKRSRFRTLGYVVAGAKIVSLQGGQPSVQSLIGRHIFALGGPLNFLIDVVWLTNDENRQALRDKFAGTYVVKVGAEPAGTGLIASRTYMAAGMTFSFREVRK